MRLAAAKISQIQHSRIVHLLDKDKTRQWWKTDAGSISISVSNWTVCSSAAEEWCCACCQRSKSVNGYDRKV